IDFFITGYSQDDLQMLLELAVNFIGKIRHASCLYLYRNKRREHFERVEQFHGNVLKPTLKDHSGDQRSPINGKIYGSFFTANVQLGSASGEPFRKSPFGDTRLLLPVQYFIDKNSWRTNLYFADFYCLHHEHHYVTLVVTQKYSEVDMFCWRHLVNLNVRSNPFLFYNSRRGFQVVDMKYLTVEVYYTHEVNYLV
ncbi:hypothetical protein HELRODRAFT_77414, partial [Helobdella robusta]|uniref:Phytanoyl-CoA hydroxylase-interacting protein-like C-terminal domain-containing protein n=1 Tax=Helobdella robusta TaxID=6412 RepID=T1G2X2_HELRO